MRRVAAAAASARDDSTVFVVVRSGYEPCCRPVFFCCY